MKENDEIMTTAYILLVNEKQEKYIIRKEKEGKNVGDFLREIINIAMRYEK